MPIHIGTTTLSEITENSNSVLQSSNLIGCERLASMSGRSSGETGTAVEVVYNVFLNHNHEAGEGAASARYTAPHDGRYWVYCWFMAQNGTTYNNKYYRLRVNNGSGSDQQVYCYSSNGGYYREFQTAMLVEISAGDYISVYCTDVSLYGASNAYTRFCVVYLG